MIYAFSKRLLDVFLSSLALVVLSPILLLTALAIILSSPGPVFFKAQRIGRYARPFTMLKFRTMHMNEEKGHIVTLRSDSRIFPIGRFLRKSKIDELPQLFNVLTGSMSIVGWRPEDEENVRSVFVGKYLSILETKPGLTSPGSLYDYTHGEVYQDEALYTAEFLPRKMDLELYYVRHRNLLYDMELVGRTILTILSVLLDRSDIPPPKELRLMANTAA